MKLYRLNKLARPHGVVVKMKNILASNDRQALQVARSDDDCPVCEVLSDGKKVGSVT